MDKSAGCLYWAARFISTLYKHIKTRNNKMW